MKKVKTTKTPWTIDAYDDCDKSIHIPEISAFIDYDDVDHEQQSANAELIIRAVNNHNALVSALQSCVKELSCYIDNSESIKVYNDAKSVLEKVTK